MKRGRTIRPGMIPLLLLALAWPATCEAQGLPATLLHQNRKLEVNVMDRRGSGGQDWLLVRQQGEETSVELAVADIRYIRFKPDFDRAKVSDLYADGKYAEAATHLKKYLVRTFRYVDIPNNVRPDVVWLIRCYYRAGSYDDVRKTTRLFVGKVPDGPLREEARLYSVLALLNLGRDEDAFEILEAMKPVDRHSEAAPLYWFARVRKSLASREWKEAREHADLIVSFAPKDFDWFPAGLYLSGKFHMARGSYDVGRQVMDELDIVAPRNRWTAMARTFIDDFPSWLVANDAAGTNDGAYEGHPARGRPGASPRTGTAVALDGEDDIIVLPLKISSGSFSIAFWLKTEDAAAGLLTVRSTEGEAGSPMQVLLKLSNLLVQYSDGTTVRTRAQDLADGNWHHLVCTHEPGKTSAFYIDGKVATEGVPAAAVPIGGVTLGYAGPAEHPQLGGELDDVQVYSRPLDQEDVSAIFAGGLGGKTAGKPKAHLALDEPMFEEMLTVWEKPKKN